MKKIAVLTCGRSDFSAYLPLLKELECRESVLLQIIALGTHTSHYHGYTISQIREEGFKNIIAIDATLGDDKSDSIAISMGLTSIRLAEVWRCNQFDLIFCLGDRYEMFAAVASAIHFNLKIVHFHGGEKTLGAVDNCFRHAITAMSDYHFTSCKAHQLRVRDIVEEEFSENVFNVGALSLQNIKTIPLFEKREFSKIFKIDISKPTVLVTYHPETIALDVNKKNIDALLSVFSSIEEQVLLTLPNNDTMGASARETFLKYSNINKNIFVYDFLGVKGYYSAMKYCSYMLGNSSSGIVEAASFGCYVINVGNRQKGRYGSDNVFHAPCETKDILEIINRIKTLRPYDGKNVYFQPDTLNKILENLNLDK